MQNELTQRLAGEVMPVTREQRAAARAARELKIAVRLQGMRIDGALALAGHAMDGVTSLDDHRRRIAQDDVARNLILAEIEETALRQVREIQKSLYNEWGL